MRFILKKYISYLLSVYILAGIYPGLLVSGGTRGFLLASVFLLVILFIKPFIDAVLFPIHLLTLNLSNWLTYILLIYLWTLISPEVRILSVSISKFSFASVTITPLMIPYWLSVIIMSVSLVLLIKIFTFILR